MIKIIPNWHPVFVHFPIAFATAAVFFFATAQIFKEKPWAAQCLITGRWMLWAAAIFACIAASFGWYAYNTVEHDEAGHLAMTTHAYWALTALFILVLLAVLDVLSWRAAAKTSYGFLILLIVAWSVVVSTAWHGGELVYRHGLGVMSLPEPEGPGHTHDHGEGHEGKSAHDEVAPHESGQTHSHDDATTGVGVLPEKAAHAPGTPPHKD
jgi:uncharacterized membrane protein